MAFEPNKNIKQALQGSEFKKENINQDLVIPSKVQSERENKKNYTFTLKPSVRKQLKMLAKQQGYNSDSQFLSDLIESIKK
ncbi:hypothetical protein SAMN04487792_1674 [Lactobacillus bombicola]|uniref:CopG family transcriptional regulator n=1 Tax=Lactobacillus bombicola TaxID=1505723 RepID=A0A1I1TXA8_9LACO|nr:MULTISPECIES: hypothetical protein [Lactobacillus]RMC47861.1 hypothetical protein F5ESL0225_07975 [Lactobacillus sp. ESL0225]SFD63276.1 hypothetical protein SAMN04487792_1674 [Lactobacillus bombicola]